MSEHRAKTGAPRQADADRIAELVERAFHYRGDVTVHTDSGAATTGYLFNRNARAAEPFVQLIETQTGCELSLPYRNITGVLFTGRDAATAADQRFEAVQHHREERAQAVPDSPRIPAEGHGC